MTENLERLKARRRGHRGIATKCSKEVKNLVQGETESSLEERQRRLTTLQGSLEEKLRVLQRLDEEILNACATEEIEAKIEEAETVNSRISESIESCKRAASEGTNSNGTREREQITPLINEERGRSRNDDRPNSPESTSSETPITGVVPTVTLPEVTSPFVRSSIVTSNTKPKLSKLMLPKFKGDVTMFQAFWDCFNSAVNNNPDLSSYRQI